MPNCVRCLQAYQGKQCVRCTTDSSGISKGLSTFSRVELPVAMAEGGDGVGGGIFPAELEIPARDTPEYIGFLEEKLKLQQDKLLNLREEN